MPKQRDSKLIEALCGRPWCMEATALNQLVSLVDRHARGELLDADAIAEIVDARVDHLGQVQAATRYSQRDQESRAAPWSLHGSVARIPIGGVIARHSSMVNNSSKTSGVGQDTIARHYAEAMADPEVGSIVFHVDSPGGAAQGLEELSAIIYQGRQTKPTYAHISGMGASAALYLAGQAEKVTADRDAIVGSIGTLMVMDDESRRFENAGIKTYVVSSGPMKGAGTRGTPITQDQLKQHQSIVDALANTFINDLARGRGVSAEAIRQHATGEVWMAAEAQSRGLIDGTLGSINELIDQLNERHPVKSAGGRTTVGAVSAIEPAADHINASVQPAEPVAEGTAAAVAAGGATMPGSNGNSTVAAQPEGTTATTIDEKAIRAQANKDAADRIRDIQLRAQPYLDRDGVKAIVDAAIGDADTTPQAFADKLLAHLTEADKPKSHIPGVQVGASGRERKNADAALVLANRMTDIESKLEGESGARVARAIGFDSQDLARKAIREAQAGVGSVRLMDLAIGSIANAQAISFEQARDKFAFNEGQFMAAAFHGSSDFPHLLSNLAKKSLLAQFNEIKPFWRNIARRTAATDFKESTTIRLSESGDLKLIMPGGTPDHTTLNERAEKIKVEKYGRAISVTYEMIRNDDLGAFNQLTEIMGRGGARLPDQLIVALLGLNSGAGPTMSDGNGAFFATGRGNLASSPAALSYAEVRKARRAMMKLRGFGPDQAYIEVDPRVLLVPTDLADTADDITMQEFVPGSEGANNQRNTMRGRLRSVHSPRLSGTRWYLFADPGELAAFEVKFLDGQEQPTVDLIESKSTPFAREFWCWLPGVGVAPVNPEAGYSNAGG